MSDIKIRRVDTEGKEEFVVGYNPYTSDYQELTLDTAGTMLDRPIRVGVNVSQYLTHEKWTIEEGDSEAFGEGVIVFRFPRNVSDIGAFIIYAAGELMDGASMYEKIYAVLGDSSGVYKWCSDEGFFARITDSSIYATPISDNRVAVYGNGFNSQVGYHMICICGNTGSLAFHTASAELANRASSITFERPDGFRPWLWFCSLWWGPITETHEIGCAIFREGADAARINADLEFYRTDTELGDLHDQNITLTQDAVNDTMTITCLGTEQFAAGTYNFFWLGQEDVRGYVHYTDDANVEASKMLQGYSGYAKGQLVQGSMTTKAAATYHPSASDQTIAANQHLSGVQTIKGVQITNLSPENVRAGVTVKVGDSEDDDCVTAVTGTLSAGGWKIKKLIDGWSADTDFVHFDDAGIDGRVGAWILYPAPGIDDSGYSTGTLLCACGDGYGAYCCKLAATGTETTWGDAPLALMVYNNGDVEISTSGALLLDEIGYNLLVVYGGNGYLKFEYVFDDASPSGYISVGADKNPLLYLSMLNNSASMTGAVVSAARDFDDGTEHTLLLTTSDNGMDADTATAEYDSSTHRLKITPSSGTVYQDNHFFYLTRQYLEKSPHAVRDVEMTGHVDSANDIVFAIPDDIDKVGPFVVYASPSSGWALGDGDVVAVVHDSAGTTVWYEEDSTIFKETVDATVDIIGNNIALFLPDRFSFANMDYRMAAAYGGGNALRWRTASVYTPGSDSTSAAFSVYAEPVFFAVTPLSDDLPMSATQNLAGIWSSTDKFTGRRKRTDIAAGGTVAYSDGFSNSYSDQTRTLTVQTYGTGAPVFKAGTAYGLWYLTEEDIEG